MQPLEDKATYLQELSSEHKQKNRQSGRQNRLKNVVINGLAIAGGAHLITQTWPAVQQVLSKSQSAANQAPSTEDIYPDNDYPLRPAIDAWNISQSYPYPRNFSKTVSEGTWLRIATHPTKDEIVFDMLGDLYCMSLTGHSTDGIPEVAHPFLTGIPFDKEAEFSSDGSHLVFTSDAGLGVDNIWTMPYTSCYDMASLSTEAARASAIQQTNSTFRFFSSPAFHPTLPKILATKWFLTGRPNGAGEIWEFPLLDNRPEKLPERGGKRLIARNLPASWRPENYFESQLGAEQARYTPAGDAIIFTRNSKDESSGKFSYNKDVHAGINAVYSLELSTGQVTELVAATASAPNKPASPGGANQPRLSHDGNTLAFVRRVDDKSVLVLKDMRSGTIQHVWDGLTYDLSTIPAFMGAYPNYGWIGNDTAIVIWSQGQIWRVTLQLNTAGERVAAGPPKNLQFEASIQLALSETRYSEQDLRDTELSNTGYVTSFRGLRSNNAGDLLVFEGAGDNYALSVDKDGGSNKAIPLPKPDEDTSCYSPSIIHGSTLFLQACWDPKSLTSFYVSDLTGKLTSSVGGLPRGRYISPVSNGDIIAYIRTGKDYMFGDVEETFGEGVWIGRLSLPSSLSGAATVSNLKHEKHIKARQETKLEISLVNDRTVLRIENPSSVVQYDIETGALETLATGRTSVEMTVSVTRKQTAIAFRDFQHIWLSFAAKERALELWSKPSDLRTPSDLTRLTSHGGHDITISGDGKRAFWLTGPKLEFLGLANVGPACTAATARSRDTGTCVRSLVEERNLNIGYQTALGKQIDLSGGTALVVTNATLMSMSPLLPMTVLNATIVIRNGQFTAAGAGKDIAIPDNAKVLNAEGGAVLPGFIDVHGHWGGFISPYPQASWEMETFLGYGVTTIHNPASKNVAGMVERHLIEKGRMYGPRVFHTGDVLYGSTQPSVYTEINSLQDAHDALLRVKIEGGNSSFSVKNYQLAARSSRQRLLLEAANLNMLVVPEGGWSLDWDLTYFIDGYTSLEHPVPIPELYDDVLSLIAASGSSYTPLAVMNYGGIFGQHWIHQNNDIPGDVKLRKYVKHDILESLTEVKKAPRSSYQFFNTTKSTAKLAKRGVRTNVGAHGEQPIGYLFHSEMQMMALGGQEPYDILRHATIGGATSLGLQASIGSVEVGKLADLVIYMPGVDTVEKLWNTSMHMRYVLRGGTLFSVEDGLVEEWPRQGRRQLRARVNAEDDA